jgi:hypothetical protein
VNVGLLVAVPAGTVTVMRPVVAPVGTFVTICVAVSETMEPDLPLNATLVAPERLRPVMVTEVPAGPDVGAKPTMAGVTVVVIRPIELLPEFVNQRAPSAAAAIPSGALTFAPK